MRQDRFSDSRREWMSRMAASSLGLELAGMSGPVAAAKIRTRAKIVIVGSGLGGISVANRLSAMLDGAQIVIIDKKEEHHYQPGLTLIATGIWAADKVRSRNSDFHPPGVTWIKDMVAAFDPASNTVTTAGGQKVAYDFLVVAIGTHQDWGLIEGMDVSAIGKNGLASVYPGPEAALGTWKALDAFRRSGGNAVMTLPATPLKCAGAPLKMTFMVRDRLRQAGTLAASKVTFYSALSNVFGVPSVNNNVLQRWRELGIGVEYTQQLKAIDVGARKAIFSTPDGRQSAVHYEFLHVAPPMRAPDSIRNSDLAWKTGAFAGGGWLEVDKATLQHVRYKNVFGVGDINGTPRGKTAATVKKSAPIVARHLVEAIAGRPLLEKFDGYTSCPLIVREGSAMLIEFDYDGKITPTLPMIDPFQESYFAWFMKCYLLQPAYQAVLKGRA